MTKITLFKAGRGKKLAEVCTDLLTLQIPAQFNVHLSLLLSPLHNPLTVFLLFLADTSWAFEDASFPISDTLLSHFCHFPAIPNFVITPSCCSVATLKLLS